jgi:putative DNA primase/helicase
MSDMTPPNTRANGAENPASNSASNPGSDGAHPDSFFPPGWADLLAADPTPADARTVDWLEQKRRERWAAVERELAAFDHDQDMHDGETLDYRKLRDVERRQVDWIWPGRIPKGKLVLLDGDPGLGKTQFLVTLLASLTRGLALPGGIQHPPMNVLFSSLEDDPEDTLAPRFDAAGADPDRVAIIDGKNDTPFTFTEHDTFLERTIVQHDARIVAVDPLTAAISADTNSHNDAEMRRMLSPISRLCHRTGATLVGIRHLKKGASTKAIMAGAGALSMGAAARVVLVIGPDPDDPDCRLLAVTKCNIGPPAKTVRFRITSVMGPQGSQPVIVWMGESDVSADDMMEARETAKDPDNRGGDAEAFLRGVLEGNQGMTTKELFRMAAVERINERTLRRAAKKLGVTHERTGSSKSHTSVWRFPDTGGYPGGWDTVTDEA